MAENQQRGNVGKITKTLRNREFMVDDTMAKHLREVKHSGTQVSTDNDEAPKESLDMEQMGQIQNVEEGNEDIVEQGNGEEGILNRDELRIDYESYDSYIQTAQVTNEEELTNHGESSTVEEKRIREMEKGKGGGNNKDQNTNIMAMFEAMMNKIDNSSKELGNKIDEQKAVTVRLETRIENQKMAIKNLETSILNKMEMESKRTDTRIEEVNQKLITSSSEIRKELHKEVEKNNERHQQVIEKTEKIEDKILTIKTECASRREEIKGINEVVEKYDEEILKVRKQTVELQEMNVVIAKKCEKIQEQHDDVRKRIEEVCFRQDVVEQQLEVVKENKGKDTGMEIEKIRREMKEMITDRIIYVNNNSDNTNPEIFLMEFDSSRREPHPMEFLEMTKKFIDARPMRWEHQILTIVKYMKGEAGTWARQHTGKWECYEMFNRAFKSRYWGVAQQKRFENTIMREGCYVAGRDNLVDYIMDLYRKNKYLDRQFNMETFLTYVSKHVPDCVKGAMSVLGQVVKDEEELEKAIEGMIEVEQMEMRRRNIRGRVEWRGTDRERMNAGSRGMRNEDYVRRGDNAVGNKIGRGPDRSYQDRAKINWTEVQYTPRGRANYRGSNRELNTSYVRGYYERENQDYGRKAFRQQTDRFEAHSGEHENREERGSRQENGRIETGVYIRSDRK